MKRPPFVLQKGVAIGPLSVVLILGVATIRDKMGHLESVGYPCSKYIFTRLLVSLTYSLCIIVTALRTASRED